MSTSLSPVSAEQSGEQRGTLLQNIEKVSNQLCHEHCHFLYIKLRGMILYLMDLLCQNIAVKCFHSRLFFLDK